MVRQYFQLRFLRMMYSLSGEQVLSQNFAFSNSSENSSLVYGVPIFWNSFSIMSGLKSTTLPRSTSWLMGTGTKLRPAMRLFSTMRFVFSSAVPARTAPTIFPNSKYWRRISSLRQKSNALSGSVLAYSHKIISGGYSFKRKSGVMLRPEEPDILPTLPLMPINSYPWKRGGS